MADGSSIQATTSQYLFSTRPSPRVPALEGDVSSMYQVTPYSIDIPPIQSSPLFQPVFVQEPTTQPPFVSQEQIKALFQLELKTDTYFAGVVRRESEGVQCKSVGITGGSYGDALHITGIASPEDGERLQSRIEAELSIPS